MGSGLYNFYNLKFLIFKSIFNNNYKSYKGLTPMNNARGLTRGKEFSKLKVTFMAR